MLIKDGRAIANANRKRILFLSDLAIPGKVMAMMTGWGRPIHLVSKNKSIRIWHQQLAHASNSRVMRAARLTDGIKLKDVHSKKYDPTEVLIESDDSDVSDSEDSAFPMTLATMPVAPPLSIPASALMAVAPPFPTPPIILTLILAGIQKNDLDNLDKLCIPCIGSKSTQIIRRNKYITTTTNKLEEVHTHL